MYACLLAVPSPARAHTRPTPPPHHIKNHGGERVSRRDPRPYCLSVVGDRHRPAAASRALLYSLTRHVRKCHIEQLWHRHEPRSMRRIPITRRIPSCSSATPRSPKRLQPRRLLFLRLPMVRQRLRSAASERRHLNRSGRPLTALLPARWPTLSSDALRYDIPKGTLTEFICELSPPTPHDAFFSRLPEADNNTRTSFLAKQSAGAMRDSPIVIRIPPLCTPPSVPYGPATHYCTTCYPHTHTPSQ